MNIPEEVAKACLEEARESLRIGADTQTKSIAVNLGRKNGSWTDPMEHPLFVAIKLQRAVLKRERRRLRRILLANGALRCLTVAAHINTLEAAIREANPVMSRSVIRRLTAQGVL